MCDIVCFSLAGRAELVVGKSWTKCLFVSETTSECCRGKHRAQAENAEKAGGSCGNVGRQAKKLRRFAKFLGNSSYLCRAIYIITEVSEVKVEVKVEVNSLRSWKL